MNKVYAIRHRFVDHIPADLEDGVVYVAIEYGTAVHRCCCGCGEKIVTPLSPTDWRLIYDGETISIKPSIGNWGLACESHYWIVRNRIEWARKLSDEEIRKGRELDRRRKREFYSDRAPDAMNDLD